MAAYQTGAVAPKPRRASAADDRVALTPEGAEYLVELYEPVANPGSSDRLRL
jgi:hypothetical protein